ncbi:hypothetical protein BGW37DRAFT_494757 [Umbelopsis sp. PMI_123]|nr:hypothetical protein BGW37DRAFT_494757 [Umbelopsis sp. PMI_123]
MMRIYSDDSPGLRVYVFIRFSDVDRKFSSVLTMSLVNSDPVVVLVLSLTFIASVFGLHIIGKFLRK